MTDAIAVTGLQKVYRIWAHPRDLLVETLTGRTRHTEFQALKDVNLVVPRGTVLGLVGRNGAGKSTLLRIVSGTLDATAGTVAINGRISAILELGTGFHPDYSGRDNIILGGLCLGLTRREIEAKSDEIIAFAELQDFIDQPFRTYSSGMQARLTFAVATSIDPDILIIDEALGVGDARFQLKSFDRIREFKARGKSILLVSHNIAQIVSICDRALLIERGQVLMDGDPNEVGKRYHELLFAPTQASIDAVVSDGEHRNDPPTNASEPSEQNDARSPPEVSSAETAREHRYGDQRAIIRSVRILDQQRQPVQPLRSLNKYFMRFTFEARATTGPLVFGFLVRDTRGIELYGWDLKNARLSALPQLSAGESWEATVAFHCNVPGGHYFLTAALADEQGNKHDVRFDCLEFMVQPTPEVFTSSLVNLDASLWTG